MRGLFLLALGVMIIQLDIFDLQTYTCLLKQVSTRIMTTCQSCYPTS